MAMSDRRISRERMQFQRSLTSAEIEMLVADRDLRVLQTAEPVENETWELLNARFFPLRPDVELRIYGHYNEPCDLSFLKRLTNVRRFAADCLLHTNAADSISQLEDLESLSIGIYDLEGFDFLSDLRANKLKALSLGATFSKKPS